MATLIQSKQIEGVVTASVIEGDFTVQSGSVDLTSASGVTGSFTGSFIGDGSELTFGGTGLISGSSQVNISQTTGYSTFSASIATSIASITDSDSQTLSISGDQLTISNGNTVTIPTGSNGGGSTDISHLNSFTASYYVDSASFDSRISGISASGSGADWNVNLQNIPSGLVSGSVLRTLDGTGVVSGSSQISFTGITNVPSGLVSSSTQITDGSGLVSGSVLRTLDGTGVLSASVDFNTYSASVATTIDNIQHTQIPSGVISGSTFTNFSSSVDSRLTTLENQTDNTGSDSQTLSIVGDQLTISGGNTVTLPSGSGSGTSDFTQLTNVPSGLVSSSAQTIANLGGSDVVSGSVLRTLDGTDVVSGSVLRTLDGTTILSSSTDFSTYSSSVDSRILTEKDRIDTILSGSNANYDSFKEIVDLINSVDTTNDQAFATHYTASNARLDSIELTTSSLQSQVTALVSATSSYLTDLPSGLVSGSTQITDGSGIVSGSVLRTLDGTGVISGSDQVTQSLDSRYLQSSTYTTDSASFDSRISSIVSSGVPAGTVSSSLQTIEHLGGTNIFSGSVIGQGNITITSGSGNIIISGSGGAGGDVTFDGNRVISNEDLGDLFTNSVNPGTTGSIQDFLNAVFYPNTAPSISTGNQTIEEYRADGASIVTLSGTDPEGQPITWGTGSSYTDDLVRVATNGVVTLNALAESSSFNTDSVGGGHGHLVTVKATDSFGTATEKDIYIIVTPNEAPKFRQTSVAGSVITSFTSNLNENSTNGTVVGTIYFTDAESDSITIYSSSIDNNHFVINKYPTYVQIVQNTGSLDYEQQTSYSFSISASDAHYEAGQDLDSITSLPITINVTDNQIPVVNNQTLSSINENSSNGATVDSIAASDNEGDSITFLNFNLHKLLLDGVEVSSGSYGGTSQLTDPTENPFQMNSSGVVTRKSGVYLNSDLINSYQYRVQVKDDFNTSSPASIITIPIDDDTPATLSDNFGFTYIIESATNGTAIRTNSNGFSGTQADLNSNQSGTWSSSNPAISINSSGNLSLGVDLSGSVTQSGDVLATTITFTNTFGTTTTQNVNTLVAENQAPTATFTDQSSNFNTNLATDGTTMVSMSITDAETDTPYSASLGGTNAGDLQLVYTNVASSSIGIQANGNLSAGTYNYDVVVTDSYSKSITYSGRSFTVAESTTGSLSTNGTFYIIESATNGDNIVTSTNGRTGTQGSVSVSYSPNYGSQSATSFASSNNLISINSSTGVLSVGNDISGSGNTNGDTITSTITWTDQYGNNGSDTISVNVAKNNAPSVFSTQTFNTNTNQATSSAEIVRLNITDTESDVIPNSGLSFTGYNSTYFTPSISTPQMKLLANSIAVPAGTYPYTASLSDIHGFETRVVSGSVTITQSSIGTLGGDTSIYIIESAENGDVFRDATGYNQGNAAQLSVSYSPNYGSQVVQSYTSSNAAIVVDGSGNLTLGVDISGSVTQSGDTITSTITFRDQYDNIGSGSVTATVFGNSSPSANFTSASSYDTDGAISGSTAGTLTVTDTENNSPFVVTLGGTDGGKFDVQGSSSPYTIQPTGSLSAGTYSINITVTDNYGENVTLTNESIIVDTAVSNGKVYVYDLGQYNSNVLFDLGVSSVDSSTPPVVTTYSGNGFLEKIEDGSLGNTSIAYTWGTSKTATLLASGSGANLDTIVQGFGTISKTNSNRFVIIAPADLDMTGVPTSMANSYGGSTAGEYVLEVAVDGASFGAGLGTIEDSTVYGVTLGTAVDGTSNYRVIVENNQVASSTSIKLAVVPSSGSTPS